MLGKIISIAICLLWTSPAFAGYLDLVWSPNSEPDLAGYVVYYGTSSQEYTHLIDVGNKTAVRLAGLSEEVEYFIALTAYDLYGYESDFSGEVSAFPAPEDGSVSVVSGGSSSGGGCFFRSAGWSRPLQ